MSKHKREVLTVKIELKVKFPEAVIINIRNFSRVFPKMLKQLYNGKIGTAASDMYVKPFICVVGK